MDIPPALQTELEKTTTSPFLLVRFDFDTPLYYCNTEQKSWDGQTWVEADFTSTFTDEPTVSFYSGTTTGTTPLTSAILSDGVAGRTIAIYQGYGSVDPILMFAGEMGECVIEDVIKIDCKKLPPLRSPRQRIVYPYFNHVPKSGTRIETLNGVVILEND